MPTYRPIDPIYLAPGSSGSWGLVTDNQRAIYDDHGPTIVSAATYAFTTSASEVVVAEWPLWKNADDQPIKTWFLWSVSTGSATATAKVEITDGSGSDSNTVTTSATSPGWSSISVTPSSSSGSPRTVRLKLSTTAGTVTVYAVASHYAPLPVNGLQASGYAPAVVELYTAGAPISSERYTRTADGPVWTVNDRPRCLFSVLDDFTALAARAMMTTAGSEGVDVYRGRVANAAHSKGSKVSVYLDADGSATATALVITPLGGSVYLTGTGWQHATIGSAVGQVRVMLANTGGTGNAIIRAVVITRGVQS
jgi:hypothetical protein